MRLTSFEVQLINNECHVTVDTEEGWIEIYVHVGKIDNERYIVTVSDIMKNSVKPMTGVIKEENGVNEPTAKFRIEGLRITVSKSAVEFVLTE